MTQCFKNSSHPPKHISHSSTRPIHGVEVLRCTPREAVSYLLLDASMAKHFSQFRALKVVSAAEDARTVKFALKFPHFGDVGVTTQNSSPLVPWGVCSTRCNLIAFLTRRYSQMLIRSSSSFSHLQGHRGK